MVDAPFEIRIEHFLNEGRKRCLYTKPFDTQPKKTTYYESQAPWKPKPPII
jgi:hypothetical protein